MPDDKPMNTIKKIDSLNVSHLFINVCLVAFRLAAAAAVCILATIFAYNECLIIKNVNLKSNNFARIRIHIIHQTYKLNYYLPLFKTTEQLHCN